MLIKYSRTQYIPPNYRTESNLKCINGFASRINEDPPAKKNLKLPCHYHDIVILTDGPETEGVNARRSLTEPNSVGINASTRANPFKNTTTRAPWWYAGR